MYTFSMGLFQKGITLSSIDLDLSLTQTYAYKCIRFGTHRQWFVEWAKWK